MYPIPPETPLGEFRGRVLEQISFTESSTCFAFGGGMLLWAEGHVLVLPESRGQAVDIREEPRNALVLLGQQVASVRVNHEEGLELIFPSGSMVRLKNDAAYECLHIKLDGSEYHI